MKRIALVFLWSAATVPAMIGYDPKDAGRTGDKLLQYSKALWVAHTYGLPFIYTPFMYSDQLKLHYCKEHAQIPDIPLEKIREESKIQSSRDVCYLINYYFKADAWDEILAISTWKGLINNEPFLTKLRSLIAPINEMQKISLPRDKKTVAVHVRKGGGLDHPLFSEGSHYRTYADRLWPIKFPPDEYYIAQLKRLSELVNDQPLYVYIFTDDKNPRRLVNKYQQALQKSNITFGCRDSGNAHNKNVLEDIFNMTQFDYLIRGGSNYCQVAHLIGLFEIVIYPKQAYWVHNKMHLDVGIMDRRNH